MGGANTISIKKRTPLLKDEVIYCILKPIDDTVSECLSWRSEFILDYFWTRRDDIHYGTKACVAYKSGFVEVMVYEMRIYKIKQVPIPISEVRCLDDYL